MQKIPAGAIARLVMVSGSLLPDAEVADIIMSYGYQQDATNLGKWVLTDSVSAGSDVALILSSSGEIIDVYSDYGENILNLNYIAMRIGWSECEIYAVNEDVETKLITRLVNVGIANAVSLASNDGVLESVSETAPPEVTVSGRAHVEEEMVQLISTQPLREAHVMDMPVLDESLVTIQKLERRVQELEAELADKSLPNVIAAINKATDGEGVLMSIIEKSLLSLLDLSESDKSGILSQLKTAGYEVKVSLSRP